MLRIRVISVVLNVILSSDVIVFMLFCVVIWLVVFSELVIFMIVFIKLMEGIV